MNGRRVDLKDWSTEDVVALGGEAAQELARRAGAASQKPSLYYVPCPNCRTPIAWLPTSTGAKAALEDAPGPYVIENGMAKWVGAMGQFAYHFETCPGQTQSQPTQPGQTEFDKIRQELQTSKPDHATSNPDGWLSPNDDS